MISDKKFTNQKYQCSVLYLKIFIPKSPPTAPSKKPIPSKTDSFTRHFFPLPCFCLIGKEKGDYAHYYNKGDITNQKV